MNKRIGIGIIALALLLVVTAAYAPDPVLVAKEPTTTDVAKMLQQVLDNQKDILTEIKLLKAGQEKLQKDVKFIRANTH